MRLELIFPLQRGAALPIELCSLAHFINILLERVDSNHRSRKTADLQSAAFDRSATLQFIFLVPQDRVELSRLSILAPKASGSTNSPTVAIYYIFVARSRVELLFMAYFSNLFFCMVNYNVCTILLLFYRKHHNFLLF